jgi:hypothetical protein
VRLLLVSWFTTLLLVQLLILLLKLITSEKFFVSKRSCNRMIRALTHQLWLSHRLGNTFNKWSINWVDTNSRG